MFIIFLLYIAQAAGAAQNGTLPVNWQQGNISWEQLQALFNQNPGYNQLNIHFPNGYVWNAEAGRLRDLYSSYSQHARAIGYNGAIPGLSFSSSAAGTGIPGGTTVPISRITSDMQAATQSLMNELDYQKYHLASYLPDWLKQLITTACNGFMVLYDFAVEELKKWL